MEATSQSFSQNYNSSLHSTRKQPVKPWKKPVTASLQRKHPRVYTVEPVNFKELVQRLTGAQDQEPETHPVFVKSKPFKISDDHTTTTAKDNPFAFDLSPSSSSRFWEAFSLPTPANLSRW